MGIGLVDVDGHNFPNFALMKIAAFHKSKGDSVEWAMPLFGHYDRVYKSKIFTFTPDDPTDWRCEVIRGGTGYDIRSRTALQQSKALEREIDTEIERVNRLLNLPEYKQPETPSLFK